MATRRTRMVMDPRPGRWEGDWSSDPPVMSATTPRLDLRDASDPYTVTTITPPLPPPQHHPASQRLSDIFDEWKVLSHRKQADYGRANAPFANVQASAEWGIEPWVGAMVRLHDKVRRLQRAAHGGTLANEGVIDSLNDIGVYAAIARVLYEQSHPA